MKKEKIKRVVRDGYAKIVTQGSSCCKSTDSAWDISRKIGYTKEELKAIPEGANLGLGCGNPVALASLREGETVLDLGSGAGLDCFLAAKRVGKNGKVIGIDMTPEMIVKARENAYRGDHRNVEFRLGEIENLPVVDNSVDIIISNCVINLSPDKRSVFKEAFRVLKPSGRLMISDIVLLKELPDFIKNSIEAYVGCLSGAIMKDKYMEAIKAAGFQDVRIIDETPFPLECIFTSDPTENALHFPRNVRNAEHSVVANEYTRKLRNSCRNSVRSYGMLLHSVDCRKQFRSMANDPTAKAITKNLKIPAEKLKDVAYSIASIKVHGVKTDLRAQK